MGIDLLIVSLSREIPPVDGPISVFPDISLTYSKSYSKCLILFSRPY